MPKRWGAVAPKFGDVLQWLGLDTTEPKIQVMFIARISDYDPCSWSGIAVDAGHDAEMRHWVAYDDEEWRPLDV